MRMPPWERMRPVVGAGVFVGAVVTWGWAFRAGSNNPAWGDDWQSPSDLRGKGVYIGNKDVETTAEREKRLKKFKLLNGELGDIKKSVLGDRRDIRGNDVVPESPDVPEGFDYNPREACMQMKIEFPERYGNVDCMSDRYDSNEPWWKVGVHGN